MNSLQPYLPIIAGLLPALFAWLGSSLAGILRQDGLPAWLNSLISIIVVAACAILNVAVAGKLTGNFSSDASATQASFNLLLAGGLHTLTPYVTSLQSNVLALLKRPAPVQLVQRPQAQTSNATQVSWQATVQDWKKQPGSSDHSG